MVDTDQLFVGLIRHWRSELRYNETLIELRIPAENTKCKENTFTAVKGENEETPKWRIKTELHAEMVGIYMKLGEVDGVF